MTFDCKQSFDSQIDPRFFFQIRPLTILSNSEIFSQFQWWISQTSNRHNTFVDAIRHVESMWRLSATCRFRYLNLTAWQVYGVNNFPSYSADEDANIFKQYVNTWLLRQKKFTCCRWTYTNQHQWPIFMKKTISALNLVGTYEFIQRFWWAKWKIGVNLSSSLPFSSASLFIWSGLLPHTNKYVNNSVRRWLR